MSAPAHADLPPEGSTGEGTPGHDGADHGPIPPAPPSSRRYPGPPPSSRALPTPLRRAAAALVRFQTARPFVMLALALLTVAVAGTLAARLTLKTSFSELLPQNKESVIVAEQVRARLVSASTLTIVAQAEHPEALQRFVDTLAPKIRALGPSMVGNVDDGVRASKAFFEKNRFLYAPLADVQRVHDEIVDRYDYEIGKALGTTIDDDDAPPPITAESLRERVEKRKAEQAKALGPSFPDGYYMEPDRKMIALLVRTPVSSGDLERSKAFLDHIQSLVAEVDPKSFDPTMTIGYTGDFITSAEEYAKVKHDLSEVGLTGVLMILGVVFLFYLRVRTLLAMTMSVGIGVVWTFGAAYLSVGHLNSSTGFLVSIVVGNGINFGIIYMARYLEARRTFSLAESIRVAHAETWLSTLAAAGAAMVAYGSLVVTNFRGFKHFGLIGGSGMLLCWIATYLFLPPVLVAFERVRPVGPEGTLAAHLRGAYGRPFAFVAGRFPRLVTIVGVVSGLTATAVVARYVANDPMEYDMTNTRNETPPHSDTSAQVLGRRVDKVVGRQGQDGLAILTDRVDQVLPLKAALDARRDAAPKAEKPFDRVVTIFDLLPQDQDEKIPLLEEARDRLVRAHKRGLIQERDWKEIESYLPEGALHPIGIDELPEQVARAFIEKDGTRGRLVYIVPATGRSVWDAHYLIQWADSFRHTELPDGSVVRGSGNAVIFADMILSVVDDAPKAILVSFAGTLLIIFAAFRGKRATWGVIATLFLGLAWMVAAMALYHSKVTFHDGMPHVELHGMKLNFLNFVALPISIGVGADYAVNIMQRYRLAGRGEVRTVILETGGAVILCSLTTMLGYFALTFSVNRAIRGFGYAAAAGEISCLVAAVLVLPAALAWRDKRPQKRPAVPQKAASAPSTPSVAA